MDEDLQEIHAERFIELPALVLATGKSGYGKTWRCVNLFLKRFASLMDRIIVICPSYWSQPIFRYMDSYNPQVITEPKPNCFKDILTMVVKNNQLKASRGEEKPNWFLFIDDLAGMRAMNTGRSGQFAHLANQMRPLNISCICIVQQATAITPAYRDNCTALLSFPEMRRGAKQWLYDEFGHNMSRETFFEMIEKGWSGIDGKKWGEHFLFIHLPRRKPPSYYVDFKTKLDDSWTKELGE